MSGEPITSLNLGGPINWSLWFAGIKTIDQLEMRFMADRCSSVRRIGPKRQARIAAALREWNTPKPKGERSMKFPLAMTAFLVHDADNQEVMNANDLFDHEGESLAEIVALANEAAELRDDGPVTEALLAEYGWKPNGGASIMWMHHIRMCSLAFDGKQVVVYGPSLELTTAGQFRCAMRILGIAKKGVTK